jgi:sugar diacid utilization regulator
VDSYLTLLADAAITGRRPRRSELGDVRKLGRRAAQDGIGAEQIVALFLYAARHLWSEVQGQGGPRNPDTVSAAAESVLQVVDDSITSLVEVYHAERREIARREEAARHQVIDDLLRGNSDAAGMAERAEPFGLDLVRAHRLVLAGTGKSLPQAKRASLLMERAVVDEFGDRDVLVAAKDDQIVILLPDQVTAATARPVADDVGEFVHAALRRVVREGPWRVALGRPYPGAYGIARSYEEAREALVIAERLQFGRPVVDARDLLVYRMLVRDEVAIVDLILEVLGPLTRARGGPEPLLETLHTYFETGDVASETARRLNISVRTVAYRLARVRALTAHDPSDPTQRLALHMAVVGARVMQWPDRAPSSAS